MAEFVDAVGEVLAADFEVGVRFGQLPFAAVGDAVFAGGVACGRGHDLHEADGACFGGDCGLEDAFFADDGKDFCRADAVLACQLAHAGFVGGGEAQGEGVVVFAFAEGGDGLHAPADFARVERGLGAFGGRQGFQQGLPFLAGTGVVAEVAEDARAVGGGAADDGGVVVVAAHRVVVVLGGDAEFFGGEEAVEVALAGGAAVVAVRSGAVAAFFEGFADPVLDFGFVLGVFVEFAEVGGQAAPVAAAQVVGDEVVGGVVFVFASGDGVPQGEGVRVVRLGEFAYQRVVEFTRVFGAADVAHGRGVGGLREGERVFFQAFAQLLGE